MEYEWLSQKYLVEGLSMAVIAKLAGCSTPTIQNYLRKFGIPTRSVSQALTGRRLSEEHKTKVIQNVIKANEERRLNGVSEEEKVRLAAIRPTMTGKCHSEVTKAKMRKVRQGKKMSEESKRKISEARVGKYAGSNHPLYGQTREDMKGENNPNWNGGVTTLYKQIRETIQYKQWRRACFERDGYSCQECGIKRGPFQVDHIVQYSILLFDHKIQCVEDALMCKPLWNTKNGRTLCIPCHEATDSFAGRGKQLLLRHIAQQKTE